MSIIFESAGRKPDRIPPGKRCGLDHFHIGRGSSAHGRLQCLPGRVSLPIDTQDAAPHRWGYRPTDAVPGLDYAGLDGHAPALSH